VYRQLRGQFFNAERRFKRLELPAKIPRAVERTPS
jgi:hypothetical protein